MLNLLLVLLALAAASAGADEKTVDDAICRASVPLLGPATTLATVTAAERYRAIVAHGGWGALPLQPSLQPGDIHPNVLLLRQRLLTEGDLLTIDAPQKISQKFDEPLTAALKKFQGRYGLPVTGILDQNTITTLNVPAAMRLADIEASLGRLNAEAPRAAANPRSVTVNIPAAEVEAVENGEIVAQYRAAAGAADSPSPELTTAIIAVNFHPGWTIPPGIIKHDLIPKMLTDPGYLSRSNYTVTDFHGNKVNPSIINWHSPTDALRYAYHLPPSDHNPLGDIRLNMPNDQAVYMHDTPKHTLFSRSMRFLSSGCVRVDGIEKLTAWLLGWTDEQVQKAVAKPVQKTVALPSPVPVHWVYITAWGMPNNVTCFRPDIYNKRHPAAH